MTYSDFTSGLRTALCRIPSEEQIAAGGIDADELTEIVDLLRVAKRDGGEQ